MGLKKKKKDVVAPVEGEGAVAVAPKKGRGNLLPAVILAIGLVLAAKMLGGGASAAPHAAAGETTTTTEAAGPVVPLDPITLNMADGRLLRVGVALQLAHDHVPAGGGGHGGEEATPAATYAKAMDLVITTLGGRTYEELVEPTHREAVKHELVERLAKAYPHEIEDLYFTQFILQ